MKLYSYFRSSASYRVRIALNVKKVKYDIESINIVNGEQKESDYLEKNKQGLVPALELDTGEILTQSGAIIEFLDDAFPEIPLIPSDKVLAAKARALGSIITNEIQPLNNLRVLEYIRDIEKFDPSQVTKWYHTWLRSGFDALENSIRKPFCLGETVTIIECCLIPQVYNAHRFKFDMSNYPKIERIYKLCLELESFQRASPEAQPDYPENL